MVKVLYIDCCIRREQSRTRLLAEAFLEALEPSWSGCLILDVRMPGMSGLELHERLTLLGNHLPSDGRIRQEASGAEREGDHGS